MQTEGEFSPRNPLSKVVTIAWSRPLRRVLPPEEAIVLLDYPINASTHRCCQLGLASGTRTDDTSSGALISSGASLYLWLRLQIWVRIYFR